jgi:cbb3-type cytochrome oxidase subunit 3
MCYRFFVDKYFLIFILICFLLYISNLSCKASKFKAANHL